MSWKPVLIGKGNKPPMVKATVKDDMLRLQVSPEIVEMVGLTPNQSFAAFIGTGSEHGQIKVTALEDGRGKVKGSASAPYLMVPAEASWDTVDDGAKCDFEILEDERSLVVNLPWYNGQSPEILRGNQKLSATHAANMIEQYRRGVSRQHLAERYGISLATVNSYISDPEHTKVHNEAVRAHNATRESKAMLPVPANPPVTVLPARPASGLYKANQRRR